MTTSYCSRWSELRNSSAITLKKKGILWGFQGILICKLRQWLKLDLLQRSLENCIVQGLPDHPFVCFGRFPWTDLPDCISLDLVTRFFYVAPPETEDWSCQHILLLGIKLPEHEADHSCTVSSDIQNAWSQVTWMWRCLQLNWCPLVV